MLLVCSALCWTIWKYRNELCFNTGNAKTPKQIILLKISLVSYWTGTVKEPVKICTSLWLPSVLDEIPLASWHPDDEDTHLVIEAYAGGIQQEEP